MKAAVIGRLIRGAVAGAAATLPMSVVLITAERAGTMPGQPPRMIVDHLLPGLDDRQADRVAAVTHILYGAAAGAALLAMTGSTAPRRPVGAAYGVLLWATGYEGWVPVLGVLPPAHRDHRGRVATMVAGHIVYGVTVAAVLQHRRR